MNITSIVDEYVDSAVVLLNDLDHVRDLHLLCDVTSYRYELSWTWTGLCVRLETKFIAATTNHVYTYKKDVKS